MIILVIITVISMVLSFRDLSRWSCDHRCQGISRSLNLLVSRHAARPWHTEWLQDIQIPSESRNVRCPTVNSGSNTPFLFGFCLVHWWLHLLVGLRRGGGMYRESSGPHCIPLGPSCHRRLHRSESDWSPPSDQQHRWGQRFFPLQWVRDTPMCPNLPRLGGVSISLQKASIAYASLSIKPRCKKPVIRRVWRLRHHEVRSH